MKPTAESKLGAVKRLNTDQAYHSTFSIPVEGKAGTSLNDLRVAATDRAIRRLGG